MDAKWWKAYPWRLIQTNLRETDMADIKADEYVRQLKEFGATLAMINTSGIIASYPTKLACHFQSPYLTGDSLRDIIAACKAAGIRVIARMDFSKVRREIYELHPQWAFRTCDGQIVDYNGDIHVCINSGYQQEYALGIIRETLNYLDVDGVYFNMGGFVQQDYHYRNYGFCHCRGCREKFRAAHGYGLPEKADMNSPAYRAYLLFQKDVLRRHEELVRQTLESIRPGLCATRAGDEGFVRWEANTAIDRPLPRWQYEAANNTKIVVCTWGEDKISSNACVDFIDFPARHMAVSPHQQRLRLYQSLAQGGALDYYVIGRLDNHADRSGYEGVKEVFAFHKANESSFQGLLPCSKILLVHDEDGCRDEYRGWYRLLAENHFFFDAIEKHRLDEKRLNDYSLVILPDCRYISMELSGALDRFTANGGKLLSVYQSGMGGEQFDPLDKPSMQCLGVEDILCDRADMRGSYFRFDTGGLIYLDKNYLYARYADDCKLHGNLIPPQPFGPPERCYTNHRGTCHPCFTSREYHGGTAVFLPWKLGAFYYRQGYAGYLAFVRELLRRYLHEEPAGGNLPEMVELAIHRGTRENFHLLTMVNNSGHFGLSFFEPVPMTGRKIEFAWEHPVTKAISLVHKKELAFRQESGRIQISIGELNAFDAIRME